MGLFSSKKKYKVFVTTQNVFEEESIPNSALNGITKALLGDTDLVDHMLEDVTSSIGIRASNGYLDIKRQDYAIGLPSSGMKSYISAEQQVYDAIVANIGQTIKPEYYYMGPLNSMHFGWQYCYGALGYSPETNELQALVTPEGIKCYLADIIATYPRADYDWMVETNDMGMLAQMGPPPNSGYLPSAPYNKLDTIGKYAEQPPFEISDVATEEYVTIIYEYEYPKGTFNRRGLAVSMGAFASDADFHMCRYVAANGKTGFFTYQNGTGTYPAIDTAMRLQTDNLGAYLPWTYFRSGGNKTEDIETAETMKIMRNWCAKLGVDYDAMNEGVHEDPNVDDVEQTILFFAANPGDKHPACIEYLFKYFSVMFDNSVPYDGLVDGLYQKMQAFTSSPSQLQHIADKRFGMSFQYSGIQRQRVPGKIGKKGTYTSEYTLYSQNTQKFLTQTSTGTGTETMVTQQPAWVYRYQVMDGMYEEVAVFGLRVNYEVHRKKGYAADKDSTKLLIPVDYTVLKTMGVPAQEQALCRFLRLQINTVIVEETPWYASDFFQVILVAVAVVITIYTAGSAWGTIAAAAAIGTSALVITVVTIIVQALVVNYGVKLFVKEFGPRVGFIAAVAAVALGSVYNITATKPAGWADALVAVGNNLTVESGEAYQTAIGEVLKEMQDFNIWAGEQMDNLGQKMDELGLNTPVVGLDGLDVVKLAPGLVIGESPSAYYGRTVHSGNIGTVGFDMVEYYATTMLQLPQLKDVEDDFNVG